MAYDSLKGIIRQYIKTNGQNEITGQILQNVLIEMVNNYPSLDGYATQQWVGNGYLPLTGGELSGNLGFSTVASTITIPFRVTPRSSISLVLGKHSVDTGEGTDDYAWAYVSFPSAYDVVAGLTTAGYFYGEGFKTSDGTSSQFLKADGSVDGSAYITSAALSGYATESWVTNQGYITSSALSGYATQSWVTTALSGYLPLTGGTLTGGIGSVNGTESYELDSGGMVFSSGETVQYSHHIFIDTANQLIKWSARNGQMTGTEIGMNSVTSGSFIKSGGTSSQFLKADGSVDSNAYITSAALSGYATESWVTNQGYITSSALSGYATETWVTNQGYITSAALSGYATQTYVQNNRLKALSYSSADGWQAIGKINGVQLATGLTIEPIAGETDLYNLKTDVSYFDNRYLQPSAISDMATQTWVTNQGYITSLALNGYATQQWVLRQGYITSSALSGYATETWVGNNYLPLTGGTLTGSITANSFVAGSSSFVSGTINMSSTCYIQYLYNSLWIINPNSDIVIGDFANNYYIYFIEDIQGGDMPSQTGTFEESWSISTSGNFIGNSYDYNSDERLKNVIGDAALTLEQVAQAPAVRFSFKKDKDNKQRVGTIAQYWQQLLPEVVSSGKDDMLGLDYPSLATICAISIAREVVELKKEIESLKKKIMSN